MMALAAYHLDGMLTVTQSVVLDILLVEGRPLTHDQIIARYEGRAAAYESVPWASPQSIRSRVAELVRQGRVVAVDKAGRSRFGRAATRWGIA